MSNIDIYTDGACSGNPGPGGWGVVILIEGQTEPIQIFGSKSYTTNNRMELKAILEALEYSKKHTLNKSNINIYSDSNYVINAINNGWIYNWYRKGWTNAKGEAIKNTDLWGRYLRLIKQFEQIKFHKVKGHAGNKYNELADLLATASIQK